MPHDPTARWKHDGVAVIAGNQLDPNTAQTPGMDRKAAINLARVGAQKLWAGTVHIHPDAKTGAHHHGALESVIYVVKGRARMRWGERLEYTAEAGPGDFIYVPPYVPHQEINASPTEVLECVLVRSDGEAVAVNLDIEPVEPPLDVPWVDPTPPGTGLDPLNRAVPTLADPRALLLALYDAAVQRALPAQSMAPFLPAPPRNGRTLVLGAGKAGGSMAAALDALWPADAPLSGLVVTRYDHVPPGWRARPGRIEVVEAAHPVPDEAGQRATVRMAELARSATADDLVICLISGGGSSLLTMPATGLSLSDKQAINKALLHSGAAIDEMNCVRKHLSAIKGGRLAALCAPARVVTLLISDVPGDDPAIIASGPTVPDVSTCADALAILRRYGIDLPDAARRGLESATFETPKPGDAVFAGHEVHLIATPQQSLEAAAAVARSAGFAAHILSDEIEGESREVGKVHAALARAVAQRGQPFAPPCVILSGGETTVTVRGDAGRGGRATEFLLGCAIALQGQAGVHVLAADTDGIDGIEDNAGAIVTPTTLARAAALGLNATAFADRNDAYNFFRPLGDLVTPGPTFTNVNDFRALLVC